MNIGFGVLLLTVTLVGVVGLIVLVFASGRGRGILIFGLLVMALGLLLVVRARVATRAPSVAVAYSDTSAAVNANQPLVRLDTGELVINRHAIDQLLPGRAPQVARASATVENLQPDTTPAAPEPPRPPSMREIEERFDQLVNGPRVQVAGRDTPSLLLQQLNRDERHELARQVAEAQRIDETVPHDARRQEYTLVLGGDRDRWNGLAGLDSPMRYGRWSSGARILVLIGTIVVAAAVLQALARRMRDRDSQPPPREL